MTNSVNPTGEAGRSIPAKKISSNTRDRSKLITTIALAAITLIVVAGLAYGGVLPMIGALTAASLLTAGAITLVMLAIKNRRSITNFIQLPSDALRSKGVKQDIKKAEVLLKGYQQTNGKVQYDGKDVPEDLIPAVARLCKNTYLSAEVVDKFIAANQKDTAIHYHNLCHSHVDSIPALKHEGLEFVFTTVKSNSFSVAHIVCFVIDHKQQRIEFYDPRGLSVGDRASQHMPSFEITLSKFVKQLREGKNQAGKTIENYTLWENVSKEQSDLHSCGVMVLKFAMERKTAAPGQVKLSSKHALEYRKDILNVILPPENIPSPQEEASVPQGEESIPVPPEGPPGSEWEQTSWV